MGAEQHRCVLVVPKTYLIGAFICVLVVGQIIQLVPGSILEGPVGEHVLSIPVVCVDHVRAQFDSVEHLAEGHVDVVVEVVRLLEVDLGQLSFVDGLVA